MRVLVAEDDAVSRRLLAVLLVDWGYEVETCGDGLAALAALDRPDAPRLAVLDWHMPGLDGVNVCRRLRANPDDQPPYLLLLTVRLATADIVAGLEAGANDYVTKPFAAEELRARVDVGARVVALQRRAAEQVRELEQALARLKQLQGLLPICMYCKKVRRTDQRAWQELDAYVSEHADVQFSHGLCPDCGLQAMKELRQ